VAGLAVGVLVSQVVGALSWVGFADLDVEAGYLIAAPFDARFAEWASEVFDDEVRGQFDVWQWASFRVVEERWTSLRPALAMTPKQAGAAVGSDRAISGSGGGGCVRRCGGGYGPGKEGLVLGMGVVMASPERLSVGPGSVLLRVSSARGRGARQHSAPAPGGMGGENWKTGTLAETLPGFSSRPSRYAHAHVPQSKAQEAFPLEWAV